MQIPSKTYKVKAQSVSEHSIYFTIVGEDTVKWMFVNSKEMESFQWIIALMTSYSKQLKAGIAVEDIINDMKNTFQPHGSYFLEDGSGREVNSIVHHLGLVLEQHALDSKLKEI